MRDPNTNLEARSIGAPKSGKQLAFLRKILGQAPRNPNFDFDCLCEQWLELTGAKWVWCWMAHQVGAETRRWEIMAMYAADGNHRHYAPEVSPHERTEDGVMQYCSAIKRPVFVSDLNGWRRECEGNEYKVAQYKGIEKHGCKSLLAVPFAFPANIDGQMGQSPYAALSEMRGGLCLHYDKVVPSRSRLSEDEYLLMAQATANAVANSFATEQRRILSELGSLAGHYLTHPGKRPDEQRKAYLDDVIQVIKNHLQVNCVSFFYRTEEGDEIECIATTGLETEDGPVPIDRLGIARYKIGQGITGIVYKTGKEFVWQMSGNLRKLNEKGLCWETPLKVPEDERSWVSWPIKTPGKNGKDTVGQTTLGVIRCVDNRDRFIPDRVRAFDPIQLQTISFIAVQLAPILETMAASIRRDRMINFVKHDLYAPLRVIDDQADVLQRHLDGRWQLSEYTPANIKAAVVLAKNMAGSLGEQQAFVPEPTLLERNIIARLREGLNRFAWVENKMQITYDSLREIPMLIVDRSLVERAISNLLLNAIKYGYADTGIEVIGEARSGDYVVRVENYGIGIEPGEEKQIFEGSYRSHAARARKQGLGLGLKIARAAMRRNGGDLRLEQANNPTIFALIFPKQLATQHRSR